MSKNNKRVLTYDDFFDYLSYESVQLDLTLKKLYDNLNVSAESNPFELDAMHERALDIINKLNPNKLKMLLEDFRYDKNFLIESIEEAFEIRKSVILRSDNGFVAGYVPAGFSLKYSFENYNPNPQIQAQKKKEKVKETPLPLPVKNKKKEEKNKNGECTYDEFITALDKVKGSSINISFLRTSFDYSNITDIVKPNKINTYVKSYKKLVEDNFNKLTDEDLNKINSSLNKGASVKLTYNKNYLLNEYARKLKDQLSTSWNQHSNKAKDKQVETFTPKFSTTAGFTSDVEKLDPKNKKEKNTPKSIDVTIDNLRDKYRADGLSVIDFIDKTFSTNLLNNFFEEFKKITTIDNINQYIDRTNKLIEEIVFYSYFPNIKRIVSAVKANYHLEFSPVKEDKEILNEVIFDELRYYQQKKIENKISQVDTTFLGSAKRISKNFLPNGESKITFEELHTSYVPHYAFTHSAFNSPFIVIRDKEVTDDFVSRNLIGSAFLAYPANVEVSKDGENVYTIYPSVISKYRY